jgi:hypothetical protein
VSLLTPFLRGAREHWGVDEATAAKAYPGDELVPQPRWSWTHGIEVNRPAADVWPWIAQIGADRGGFYSYQWLENVAGCEVRNAERIHPEWEHHTGDGLRLHLSLHAGMPPPQIVALERGRYLLAYAAPDTQATAAGKSWASATWLLLIEPLDDRRCRVISRFRAACSDDLATRLSFGPTFAEPIGFAMDRRMLMGIRARSERVVALGASSA